MQFTLINESNEIYFDGAVHDHWSGRGSRDIFFGAVDEEDDMAAAGAVAWEMGSDAWTLRYIGVEEERRRKGTGGFLLEESAAYAAKRGAGFLTAYLFDDDGLKKNEPAMFFKACGFEIKELPVWRQVFDPEALYALQPVYEGKDEASLTIIKAGMVNDEEREELFELAESLERGDNYLEPEEALSPSNIYGGLLKKNGKLAGWLVAGPFEDGVRLSNIAGRIENVGDVKLLVDHALDMMQKEGKKPAHLYVDVAGESLRTLFAKHCERAGIKPEREMTAYMGIRRI